MLLESGQQGLGPTSLWFTCSSPGTEPGVWDTKTDGGRLWAPPLVERRDQAERSTVHMLGGAGEGRLRKGHGKLLLCKYQF